MGERVRSKEMEIHLHCEKVGSIKPERNGTQNGLTISLSSIKSMASLSSTVGLFRENSSVLSEYASKTNNAPPKTTT